jgi:hypothetical protein
MRLTASFGILPESVIATINACESLSEKITGLD